MRLGIKPAILGAKVPPNGRLRFTNVALENWRNFSSVDVALARRVFLLGPNASGKSNLLDAFRFLRDIVSIGGGFQEAVRRRGGVSAIRCLAARRYPEVRIRVEIGSDEERAGWLYELAIAQDNQQRPLVAQERVLQSGQVILSRPEEEDRRDDARLSQTHLEQVNVNLRFREIADFLKDLRYLHIVPQLVREPERSVGRKNDPFGGDFLEQVGAAQKRTRDARLRRITDALRVAVPQLRELVWERDATGTPHLKGRYEHWRAQGAWQDETQFSDGTLRLLGLLWAILDGKGPLLLEEPELSLHQDVIRQLPALLARAQRSSERQVLVSSHSSNLLEDRGIGLDEVLLLFPGQEGTSVRPASTVRDVKELLEGGMSLAEAVMPLVRPPRATQLGLFDVPRQ